MRNSISLDWLYIMGLRETAYIAGPTTHISIVNVDRGWRIRSHVIMRNNPITLKYPNSTIDCPYDNETKLIVRMNPNER